MSEPLPGDRPGPGEAPGPREYGLDDLVRQQKRQTWLVALLLVGAVLVTSGRQLLAPDPAPDEAPAAPPTSATGE